MNWDILSKYIKGNCSPKELRQLQDWLKADAANEDFFQSYVEAEKDVPDIDAREVHEAWEQLKKTHFDHKKSIKGLYETDYMPAKSWWKASGQKWAILSAAAVLILLITVPAVFMLQRKGYFASIKTTKKITYRTITTQKGQQSELRLKDGTKIKLNAASRLKVPENYGAENRVVYLQGEAFFKVVHNEKMPFSVKSGSLMVRDVGTQFDISAYDTTNISIAVKEGKVSVGKISQSYPHSVQHLGELDKNKAGIFDQSGTFSISTIHNMDLFTGWTKGEFVFRDTPFSEVVQRLERRFNIKGKIADPKLKKRTLTATYEDLSLGQILNVLSASLHISFRHAHNTIVFKDNRTN
jgi:ferric-dicitrate binding protein FerR (iron transport regulator)